LRYQDLPDEKCAERALPSLALGKRRPDRMGSAVLTVSLARANHNGTLNQIDPQV